MAGTMPPRSRRVIGKNNGDHGAGIVLPADFTIEDAVTPADLEEVIGRTGWETFPRLDTR